jgi:hypothetical protein
MISVYNALLVPISSSFIAAFPFIHNLGSVQWSPERRNGYGTEIPTLPFLYVGTWRSIMFPEHGKDVPFRIENYAYIDPLGRETLSWVRTFSTKHKRRFDAYMIFSEERGGFTSPAA